MSDRLSGVKALGGAPYPGWTPERAAANELAMLRRGARRRSVRRALVIAATVSAVVVCTIALRPRAVSTPDRADGAPVRYIDGSLATPTTADASLRIVAQAAGSARSELTRGGYRFNVVKGTGRVFSVDAGGVHIEVMGTEFTVDRLTDERVRVAVYSGRVRVVSSEERVELGEGQLDVFPHALAATTPRDEESGAAAAPAATVVAPPHVTHGWVRLAQSGDYDAAYTAMKRTRDPARSSEELMLAADAARLSHHPAEAVAPLRTLLAKHASDPRASLAAFTLGRVLLDDLGEPLEAAAEFARVRTLAPNGALAEDALAREVEAWSRGGDLGRARERAEVYLARYPAGTRARSVRRFGGQD